MRRMIESPATPVERELSHLLSEILDASPRRGLAAHRVLASAYLPWLERRLVHRMRVGGASWTGIGRVLGVSRQAVQKRFDRPVSLDDMLPPTLPDKTTGPHREERELLAKLHHLRQLADADASGQAVPW